MKKRKQSSHKRSRTTDKIDIFGSTDPRKMSAHFFHGAIHIAFGTAKMADVSKQNFSVAPRHWYVDADFNCAECGLEFTWTVREQRLWFEKDRFYVDARPRHCLKCRANRRHLKKIRKEYDASVASAREDGSIEEKQRIVSIVEELERALTNVPDKMRDIRDTFVLQIEKMTREA